MEKIVPESIYKKDGATILKLDKNYNLTGIYAKLSGKVCGKAVLKIAQNGIITDLIDFAEITVDGDSFEVKADKAVSASHIYLYIPEEAEPESVDIFVMEDISGARLYPRYEDTDLGENYYLDSVTVFTPPEGFSRFRIYTSLNGRDFEFLAKKTSENSCDPEKGDVFPAGGREARIIRVYLEYNSQSVEAIIRKVCFEGRKSGTAVIKRPPVSVESFDESPYNVEVNEKDTYDEVYGIIERRLGEEYKSWFELSLEKNPLGGHNYDYFSLEDMGGKIIIKGNCGVSLAAGLNHYLKYYCKVNISQVGDQTKMPSEIVCVKNKIFKETKAKVRYSYNYCTLSYSMAFWGEKEWRDEIDWLALNGVNVVLDATAQEEVWRRFLTELGYSHDEIKKYIAGPAYYAWAYMANLYGYGGPVHDSWFGERTGLARKNHLIMRKLGMYPVLQGYSGMVPVDISEHDAEAEVIPQGTWCSFERPSMLKTTSAVFEKYAEKFYNAQKEVYGTYSKYFATDPFHEGGITADMSPRQISNKVLSAMLKANNQAIWIIQSWQQNPTSELLAGLGEAAADGKEHALILDLYAEKLPNYYKGEKDAYAFGYSAEFDHTPWVFCMLNNFGGRLGLHGHLDNLALWIPKAFNECSKIAGIGITPEASVNNPVLYDFLFECIWQDNAEDSLSVIDLKVWLHDYAQRRYGKKTIKAEQAWDIFKETVYKAKYNNIGEGAPESVLNARPSLGIKSASTWGNSIISYDKKELEKAAKLLSEGYDELKESDGYIYDLITVLQQVLSNKAQDNYNLMVESYYNKKVSEFEKYSSELLKIADKMEKVTGCSKYYMLGRWVEQAKALADNADDFSKALYEFNAKAIVTTWGAYNQAETGQLHDYSNRQWSGLIGDFYKPRWERWIKARISELKGEEYEKNINWFEWEWNWAFSDKKYPTEPAQTVNLCDLAEQVL